MFAKETSQGVLGGIWRKPGLEVAARQLREVEQKIDHVAFGHVINTEPRDMYLSRVAAVQAGIPNTTPAMNVNRLCGSGAQAIVSAVQSLMLGDSDFAVAGGAESMSRSPYIVPQARWGAKMGDVRSLDMMLGALNCPFGTGHMGVTAENSSSPKSSAAALPRTSRAVPAAMRSAARSAAAVITGASAATLR